MILLLFCIINLFITHKMELIQACNDVNYDKVKLLIENRIDVNYVEERFNDNALLTICRFVNRSNVKNNIKIVKLFIKNNIDINHQNYENMTAFLFACLSGRSKIIKLLLNYNPNINIEQQNTNGDTGIILASRYSHIKTIKTLIKYGANVA